MKKFKRFMKNDRGAAQMIEAAILYPIVFLLIFVLIYIGLYILQSMTVSSYSQKIAMLAAREVAHPFYIDEVGGTIGAGDEKGASNFNKADTELTEGAASSVSFEKDPTAIKRTRAYRYWKSNPIKGYSDGYRDSLLDIIGSASIVNSAGSDKVKVDITSENYFVTQYITVKVEQEIVDFPVLDFFGIKSPTVSASAMSSVNDVDEFVRNSDFAVDTVSSIAKKLGIDPSKLKEKISNIVGNKESGDSTEKDGLGLDDLEEKEE